MSTAMNAPTGIDFYPDPPAVRRVKKGVVICLACVVGTAVFGIVYGIHAKGEHHVKETEIRSRKINPASGRDVANAVPQGTIRLTPEKTTPAISPASPVPVNIELAPPRQPSHPVQNSVRA